VLEFDGAAKGFLSTTSDFALKISTDALLKKVIPPRIHLPIQVGQVHEMFWI
jgi:hypothetical protein